MVLNWIRIYWYTRLYVRESVEKFSTQFTSQNLSHRQNLLGSDRKFSLCRAKEIFYSILPCMSCYKFLFGWINNYNRETKMIACVCELTLRLTYDRFLIDARMFKALYARSASYWRRCSQVLICYIAWCLIAK